MSLLWRSVVSVMVLVTGTLRVTDTWAAHDVPRSGGDLTGVALADGKDVTINSGKRGTVVAFMSARCPCSNAHVELLKKLSGEFKDFSFVVINANTDEPLEEARTYFRGAAFAFPVLRDEEGKLADRFKALKTPHVYLLAPDGATLYRGGMTGSVLGTPESTQYLRDALADVDAGRPVKTAEGRTLGCMITRGPAHGL